METMKLSLLIISLNGVLTQTSLEKKVFVFPKTSADAYVLLKPTLAQPLRQFSICLRFFTEKRGDFSLFSASSRAHENEILIFKLSSTGFEIYVGNKFVSYTVPWNPVRSSYWESLCATWDSGTGIVQFWLDGQALPRKVLARGYEIPSDLSMMVGQEQDSYGGSFDARQCFVGEMAEVYMWNAVLPPEQLRNPGAKPDPKPIVDWMALKFETNGSVLIEPSLV